MEEGETPFEVAKRELYEESGAVDYHMVPLCDYCARTEDNDQGDNGMVFKAVIHKLNSLPESEMAEVKVFDTLPENLTYPTITLDVFEFLKNDGEHLHGKAKS